VLLLAFSLLAVPLLVMLPPPLLLLLLRCASWQLLHIPHFALLGANHRR
jgi:hypothetical protein